MDIEFNGGDEVRQPFRIVTSEGVADLTGCTVSLKLFSKQAITLPEGDDLVIENRSPLGDQAHGYFILNEEATLALPLGRIAYLRFIVVNADGVTVSTSNTYLRRAG
ncbi:hypothetical protein [Agrobacterium tumefaciens]|uniref:hypothetical protein n=1 Tax=Agrobacterium tumefaciens TaxID=358 RepID=UPI0021CF77EC|nr:hypothetical protein [Agrobacterium tumefaciens]UXS01618.1 hypothetical protein FY156_09120 [Agrobacterium tumefaciens]